MCQIDLLTSTCIALTSNFLNFDSFFPVTKSHWFPILCPLYAQTVQGQAELPGRVGDIVRSLLQTHQVRLPTVHGSLLLLVTIIHVNQCKNHTNIKMYLINLQFLKKISEI